MPFAFRNTLTNSSTISSFSFASLYRELLNFSLAFTSMRITPIRRCKTTKSISSLTSSFTKRVTREGNKGWSFGRTFSMNSLYLNCENTNIGWSVSCPNFSRTWNICNSAKSPFTHSISALVSFTAPDASPVGEM